MTPCVCGWRTFHTLFNMTGSINISYHGRWTVWYSATNSVHDIDSSCQTNKAVDTSQVNTHLIPLDYPRIAVSFNEGNNIVLMISSMSIEWLALNSLYCCPEFLWPHTGYGWKTLEFSVILRNGQTLPYRKKISIKYMYFNLGDFDTW